MSLTGSALASNETIELTLKNGTVSGGWWTPQAGKILCSICGNSKDGKPQEPKYLGDTSSPCFGCMNRNPYCG